jgi:hypothetical protein
LLFVSVSDIFALHQRQRFCLLSAFLLFTSVSGSVFLSVSVFHQRQRLTRIICLLGIAGWFPSALGSLVYRINITSVHSP